MSAWVLALAILAAADATQVPVHLGSRGRSHKVGAGRGRAFPMGAADQYFGWGLPGVSDTLRVTFVEYGAHDDSTNYTRALVAYSRQDPRGIELIAHTDAHESLEPDSTWMGKDLNADGEPDVVVRRSGPNPRSVVGQWIEVLGLSDGQVHRRITRSARWVPRSVVRLEGAGRPLVLALEPHDADWPSPRVDPPCRNLLLALEDTTARDVSLEHAQWYGPQITASDLTANMLEARGDLNVEWATQLLAHTWALLSQGRKAEARSYFEGHMARASHLGEALRRYLEHQRPSLETEWAGS